MLSSRTNARAGPCIASTHTTTGVSNATLGEVPRCTTASAATQHPQPWSTPSQQPLHPWTTPSHQHLQAWTRPTHQHLEPWSTTSHHHPHPFSPIHHMMAAGLSDASQQSPCWQTTNGANTITSTRSPPTCARTPEKHNQGSTKGGKIDGSCWVCSLAWATTRQPMTLSRSGNPISKHNGMPTIAKFTSMDMTLATELWDVQKMGLAGLQHD